MNYLGLSLAFTVMGLASAFLPEYYLVVLCYIGLASIAVIGLVLLTGGAGITSFGQAAFVGIGAYATGYLTSKLGYSPYLGLLAGFLATFIAAYIIGVATLRLSGHYLALSTIAWGISLFFVFGNLEQLGGHTGMSGIPSLKFAGFDLSETSKMFWLIWLVTLGSLVMTKNILESRIGRALRALKSDPLTAESFGVDTVSVKIAVFIYAALLASLAGWLYAHFARFVNPTPFGLNIGVEYQFMTVIGGVTTVWGAIVGSSLVLVIKEWLQTFLPTLLGSGGNYEIIIFGIFVLAFLQMNRDAGIVSLFNFGWRAAPTPVTEPPLLLEPRARGVGSGPLLQASHLRKTFGGLVAVDDVSFEINSGEIVALVGPNGAGKTTLLNAVAGLFPSTGEVYLNGEPISHLSTEKRIARGLCLVSERRELFATMTVEDNLLLGAYSQYRKRQPYRDTFSTIYDMFPRLHERRKQQAGTLSGGERQMLAIGRALMSKPKMLLLDEPSLGLSPKVTKDMLAAVAQLRTTGVSILLVEQNVRSALRISDHAYVLETGAITMSGPAGEVAADSRVIDSYLGVVNTPT